MMNRKASVVVAAATAGVLSLGLACGTASGSMILIDDFTTVGDPNGWPLIVDDLGATASFTETGLNTLGGTRTTFLQATFIAIPGLDTVQANAQNGFGELGFSSSVEAAGMLRLTYDGGGALNADFSGQSAIEISFNAFDLALGNPLPVMVRLSDGQTTVSHQLSLTSSGAQDITFDFSDFTGIQMLDMENISMVEVEFDGAQAADFTITQITTVVPNPAGLALLGLAGVLGLRRRRN